MYFDYDTWVIFGGAWLINQMSTSLGKNISVVLVADHLVFQRTQVRFQQRKIQVTCTFRAMSSKVVGFHEDATVLSCSVATSQTPHRSNTLCLRSKMWHWYGRKGTSVRFDDGIWCLQSTSCLFHHGGPVQSASLSRPWWCYQWSQTEYRKPRSWALMVGGYRG